jgi:hypothetical protein
MVRGGRAEAPVPRSDVSFRLDRKTGNFNAAAAMISNVPENQHAFPHDLQHASNIQHKQAMARQAQRTAQHARRCSRTCTFFKRPRVTRSITASAQLHDMKVMCTSAGAVAIRWHANATQGRIRRTRPHGEHSATTQPRGGSACCRQ